MTARRTTRKRNPFRGVMDLMSEMNRMSDEMAGIGTTSETQRRSHVDAWNPPTDVLAKGNDLVIRMELPGVAEEELEVTFSNGLLTIAGERKADSEDAVYYMRERFWGVFRRTMTLPDDLDDDQVSAHLEEGLLEITVSEGATAGPRAIEVTSKRKSK